MIRLITVFMAVVLISATTSFAGGGGTSANLVPDDPSGFQKRDLGWGYAVLPFEHYYEEDGVPPVLKVTFQLKCFQKFIKVIRHEDVDGATGKVVIAVGILVREDFPAACESAHELTVHAGTTFSGREHTVVPIQEK